MRDNVTVREIAQYFGISLRSAYDLVRQPGFPAFRVGGKILIPIDRLQVWIETGGTKRPDHSKERA